MPDQRKEPVSNSMGNSKYMSRSTASPWVPPPPPLEPLLVDVFMCSLEEQLQEEGTIPTFYKRYVDDTFAIIPSYTAEAHAFLDLPNSKHPALIKVHYGIGH